MARWQVQQAKQQFSRLVDQARAEGPQVVTRHGKEVAVVLDVEEYRRLRGVRSSFKEFLRGPPYVEVDHRLERDRDPGREIEL